MPENQADPILCHGNLEPWQASSLLELENIGPPERTSTQPQCFSNSQGMLETSTVGYDVDRLIENPRCQHHSLSIVPKQTFKGLTACDVFLESIQMGIDEDAPQPGPGRARL